jgi:uncharacterized membrane protein YjjP (DUF1212 family)
VDGFDVVVKIARLTLASSAEGIETLEQSVDVAARAYGLDVSLVVLPEQVVVTDVASGEAARVAVVRAAPGIFRLDQVAALKRILMEVVDGLPAGEACRSLDAVETMPPRWPWWARAVGVALFAAGFAPSVVATWGEVAAALILGMVMGLMVVGAAGRAVEGLLPFFGAFVVTALGLTLLGDMSSRTGVTLMVLPALFIVVPGDTLSAAAGELLSGRLTSGAIRLVFGAFVLGLIVTGIVAAAAATGHHDALTETFPEPEIPLALILLGWVVFSIGLVLVFNAEATVLVWLIPSVVATFLLQQGATMAAGTVVGTLVAGAALGAFANLVSGNPRRPPRLLLVLGGFFVLTVGGMGVRGVTALMGGDVVNGLRTLSDFLLQVPTVALAIAVGVLLSGGTRTLPTTRAASNSPPP